mgnify:CR=1 FL=1
MEQTISLNVKIRKTHLVMAIVASLIFLFILRLFLGDKISSITPLIITGIIFLIQWFHYYVSVRYLIKYSETELKIQRDLPYAKVHKITKNDVLAKQLATGNIEISWADKNYELSKDSIDENDFKKLQNYFDLD